MRPKTLDDFRGPHRMSGEQRNYKVCPVCGSTAYKVYVNPDEGTWICFAGACGAKGRVSGTSTTMSLRKRLFTRDRGAHTFSPIDLPENLPLEEKNKEWLRSVYNLPEPDDYLLRLGVGELGGRIIIPYVGGDGSIIGWNARTICGESPKYKMMDGPKPLYIPNRVYKRWINASSPTVIVEGAFDAMSVHARIGFAAVSLGGKTLAHHLVKEMVRYCNRGGMKRDVRILLDRDATTEAIKLMHVLRGKMPEHDIQVRMCPGKDPALTHEDDLRRVLP